jgi:hypothetical protein
MENTNLRSKLTNSTMTFKLFSNSGGFYRKSLLITKLKNYILKFKAKG